MMQQKLPLINISANFSLTATHGELKRPYVHILKRIYIYFKGHVRYSVISKSIVIMSLTVFL